MNSTREYGLWYPPAKSVLLYITHELSLHAGSDWHTYRTAVEQDRCYAVIFWSADSIMIAPVFVFLEPGILDMIDTN